MLSLHGYGVGDGIAIGRALIIRRSQPVAEKRRIDSDEVPAEIERFLHALNGARLELRRVRGEIPENSPPEVGSLIDAHLMMLDDPLIADEPMRIIERETCNADWAVQSQGKTLSVFFESMDDGYLRSKKDDVNQVVGRILWQLAGSDHSTGEDELSGRILITNDLTPSDAVMLKDQRIAAFATNLGGPISHTAILARSLRIPAIVGLHGATRYIRDGETIIVDGTSGIIIIDPDPDIVEEYSTRRLQSWRELRDLSAIKHKRTMTRDGEDISLLANIELPGEANKARKVRADGVGLFRTEYLFMNREEPPGEEEQLAAYLEVIEKLDRPITIRTLDIGADKQSAAVGQQRPAINPALGLRAIRLCLSEPGIFRPQIRAILRASAVGEVELMVPMVSSLGELDRVLDLIGEIKRELRREGLDFDADMRVGGMIEVPAAAISADLFARRLDFLSIGTNDLIQYTLAIDRVDDDVNYLYDPLHPAVLSLIQNTIDAGVRNNIPVSMCGEMAGDPQYTRLLLGMNLKTFSMDPLRLLQVKQLIRDSDTSSLRDRTTKLLNIADPNALRDGVEALNA